MISEDFFYNITKPLFDVAEKFQLTAFGEIVRIAKLLAENPNIPFSLSRSEQRILKEWLDYNDELRDWIDNELPKAYKKGIDIADKDAAGARLSSGKFSDIPLFETGEIAGEISDKAKQALKDLPEHHRMYGVFERAAYDAFEATKMPIVRDVMDKIRELTIMASERAYLDADTFTRLEFSQDLMRRFANEGITGVTYRDGRTMSVHGYTEMVARTQTANAARQAHINRLQEYGRDLVVISQHYPVSDLCQPWQGSVYSLSGASENYPPLSRAISGGLYHPNCKHSQSGYTPGTKIPEAREKVDKRENAKRYEAQNRQRAIERQIRKWKTRKATALTDRAENSAQAKILEWQKRQREHLKANPFLRRRYAREQI